jgi:O-antigen/teichoic acid export membrane protein
VCVAPTTSRALRPHGIGELPSVKTLSRFVSTGDRTRGDGPDSASGTAAIPDRRRTLALIAYKTVADVSSKLASLAIAVAAARLLPGQDFGVLALAMTTGWLLSVASDAGLPLYLAKRLARRAAGDAASFAPVAEALRIRAMLATVGSAAGLAIAVVLAPGASVLAFWMIVVAQLLNAVLETLAHAYRGLGRSEIESTIVVAQRFITAVTAVAALLWSPSLLLLAAALVVPPAAALGASLRTARRLLPDDLPPVPIAADHGASPYSHVPVGLAILLSAIYFRCDVFFIERWRGLEAVGAYNAAFRIVEALRLFPAAVLAVSFPALCTARDGRLLRALVTPLVVAATFIAAAVYLTAPLMLELLYGARFVDAAPALAILALAVPLFFANYALTHQVIAWDGQRAYLAIVTGALAANLIGNVALIPARGLQGAAISTVVTEVVVTLGCLVALARLGGTVGVGRTGYARPHEAS